MLIKKPVGKGRVNHWIDVLEVQLLLNDNKYLLNDIDFLEMEGYCGEITIAAIMAYQKQVMKLQEPDGWIGPTGSTLKSLIRTAIPDLSPVALSCKNIATSQNLFPLFISPEKDYKTGMRRFGARRDKGKRLHAGCDLYAPKGTRIRAMQDGTVMRPVEYFYLSTYVLTIHHGDFIARYGEISHAQLGIKNGAKIKKGDTIAYVGELNFKSGNVMSMLHLELYSGTSSGPLSASGNKYKRRADLLDPTSILDAASR